MNLKSIKHNQNLFIIIALFIFFFFLRHNQIFYQFKFFFDDQNFFYSVINYLNFYIDNQNLSEIFIYILLLIPGYVLIKSKFNFENTSIFFLYLFFFAPFIIFFSILNDNFYSVLSDKKFSLSQKNLYILSFLLYINLIVLIFFSKLDFKIKIKYFYIKIRNLKIVTLSVIIFFFSIVLFDINSFSLRNINIDLSYLMIPGTDYRNFLHGATGYLYYMTLYVFLPLLYLIEKKTGNLLLVIFIYLLLYILFKHKIALFFTITIIVYHYKSSFFLERFYFKTLKIILIYLITTFICSYLVDHFFKVETSFFFERFFLSQTKNLFLVYDYLNINGPIYLSHIGILNKSLLLPVDTTNPIIKYEGNFFDLIGGIYGGGSAVSNSYIMDGLASFGLKGLFFISILLTVLFKLIDTIIEFKKNDFQLIYLYQIIGFLSFPLSTHLLTYGLAASIFLGMIRLKT